MSDVSFLFSDLPAECLSDLMYEYISNCSVDNDIFGRRVFLTFHHFYLVINVCPHNVHMYSAKKKDKTHFIWKSVP